MFSFTPRTLGFGVLAFAILGGVTGLGARPEFFSAWGTLYAGSSSDNNASCNLCHGGSGFDTFNPYGWRVRAIFFGGSTIEAAIHAVESEDSDADPTGSSNLDEINASSQPGWTGGSNNTIFTSAGSSTSGNNPPVIPGDVDPAVAAGAIDVSPLTLAFGSVDIGRTATLPATVQNVGAGDLEITGLSVTGAAEFSVSRAAPIVLAPGDSLSLSVVYAPLDSGDDAGTLMITSDDPDEPQVQVDLSGTGTQPPILEPDVPDIPDIAVSPLVVPFGSVLAGESADVMTTVRNNGTGDLILTDLSVTGAEFTLGAGAAMPNVVLPAGEMTDVPLTCRPLSAGDHHGVLSIASNDADSPTIEVMLRGTGTEALQEVDGATLYANNCSSCHGAEAKGGIVDEDVRGESAREIMEAIVEERDMRFLSFLTATEIQKIADDEDDEDDEDEDRGDGVEDDEDDEEAHEDHDEEKDEAKEGDHEEHGRRLLRTIRTWRAFLEGDGFPPLSSTGAVPLLAGEEKTLTVTVGSFGPDQHAGNDSQPGPPGVVSRPQSG